MNRNIARAVTEINRDGFNIIYSEYVRVGVLKSKRIIVVTDRRLHFFDKKGNRKYDVPFVLIGKLDIYDCKIHLKYDKGGKRRAHTQELLIVTDNRVLFCVIANALQNVLVSRVYKIVVADRYGIEPVQANGRGAVARLREGINVCGIQVSEDTMRELEDIIMFGQPRVELACLPDSRNVSEFVAKTVGLCPEVKSLVMNVTGLFDNYTMLKTILASKSSVRHVEVHGMASKEYTSFLKHIREFSDAPLRSISLVKSQLNMEMLKELGDVLDEGSIRSIGLHSAVDASCTEYLYETFLSRRLCDKIMILNFTGTRDIDVRRLLPNVSTIYCLSLEDCGVDVADIVSQIANLDFTRLKVLNISRNKCEKLPEKGCTLPQSLDTLFVDGVEWSSRCLVAFISFCFGMFQNGLHLYMRNVVTGPRDWTGLFDVMRKTKFNKLRTLRWDNNVVHPDLFFFLERNSRLEVLSLNQCFGQQNRDAVHTLCGMIRAAKQVRKLYVRSSNESLIGMDVRVIIELVKEVRCLELLDISGSQCGNAGIILLKGCLSQRTSLTTLVFDGAAPEDASQLMELLTTAAEDKRVNVSFPSHDLYHLLSDGKLTTEAFTSISDRKPESGYFERPFRIFKYYDDDRFPVDFVPDRDDVSGGQRTSQRGRMTSEQNAAMICRPDTTALLQPSQPRQSQPERTEASQRVVEERGAGTPPSAGLQGVLNGITASRNCGRGSGRGSQTPNSRHESRRTQRGESSEQSESQCDSGDAEPYRSPVLSDSDDDAPESETSSLHVNSTRRSESPRAERSRRVDRSPVTTPDDSRVPDRHKHSRRARDRTPRSDDRRGSPVNMSRRTRRPDTEFGATVSVDIAKMWRFPRIANSGKLPELWRDADEEFSAFRLAGL